MASVWFGRCPHCNIALSYLQGVTGSTITPICPGCRQLVTVTHATLLTPDHSRRSLPINQLGIVAKTKQKAAN